MGFLSEYKQVTQVLQKKHPVVFYAESRHYFTYFEKLISDLLAHPGMEICYITSDAGDPLLTVAPAGVKVIYIKWMLGFLFSRINADVIIMTMPDLDSFLFKRSKHVDTYIYIFHAAVSTHQQYRKRAFFNYDAIFCTGNYQEMEIRIAETLYGKKEKTIIHYGYPLFDALKSKREGRRMDNAVPTILIAPSWFEGCIFDTCLEELLQQLAAIPCKTILRSHPEYEKRKKKEFRKIQQLVAQHTALSMDELPDVIDRLSSTDILITDRSGIAFEFAIGVGKPVLFIDTVFKKVNPDWKELDLEPIENTLRSQLGIAVLPSQLDQLPQKIIELSSKAVGFAEKMNELERSLFYHAPGSYTAGLEYVLSKIRE